MRKLYLYVLIACLAALSIIGNIAAAPAAKAGADKVTLQMSWFPSAEFAPYIIGIEKGFYRDEEIDVKVAVAKGSGLATKLVGNGDVEFANAAGDIALIARAKGMPLKVLAIFYQGSGISIFSLEKAGIKKPKDLEGKSFASDIESMKHTQFLAFCKKNGVDIAKVKIIPIKGSDLKYVLSGIVDAMSTHGYKGDALLRQKGYKVNEMKLSDYGIDMYSKGLIANDKLIKENPELVRRFVKATIRSWNYAVKNPEEAVDALIKAYPDLNKEDELIEMRGSISLMQNEDTEKHGVGYQSEERWKKTQDLLYEEGLTDKKIDLKEIFTDEFLPQSRKL